MVEKKVRICDICKKKVSKSSCEICGRDSCEDCSKDKVVGSMVPFMHFHICMPCENVLQGISIREPKYFEEVMNERKDIRDGIVECLKNIVMLKKIDGDSNPKGNFETITLTPPSLMQQYTPVSRKINDIFKVNQSKSKSKYGGFFKHTKAAVDDDLIFDDGN